MEPQPIYQLLEKVHEFYPVGMKTLHGYPGQQRIMDIIEKKINAIINEEQTAGSVLVNALRESAAGYEVFDYNYRQFPSYTMSVLYEEVNCGDMNRRTEIVFTISLLCDYYTYFVHDYYRIAAQTVFSERRKVYQLNAVSLDSHLSFEKIKPIIEKVAMDIKKYFPQHRYVSHVPLFYSNIDEAVPYGQIADYTPTHPYVIYHFLFDGTFAEESFVMQ